MTNVKLMFYVLYTQIKLSWSIMHNNTTW